MPPIFPSQNIQHVFVCKSGKQLDYQDKFILSCKSRSQKHNGLSSFQICLEIPSSSLSLSDNSVEFSSNIAPKQLFLNPKNGDDLV